MDIAGSDDPRLLHPDDKRSALWKRLNEDNPLTAKERIVRLSRGARDLSALIMKQARLDPSIWTPVNPSLVWTPKNAPQGPPCVNAAAPNFVAIIHLTCCTERTMILTDCPPVGDLEALRFLGVDTHGVLPREFLDARPDVAAHVNLVRGLCQPREKLEAALKPWGGERGDFWANPMHGVIMKGETVTAEPPRCKEHPCEARECAICKGEYCDISGPI